MRNHLTAGVNQNGASCSTVRMRTLLAQAMLPHWATLLKPRRWGCGVFVYRYGAGGYIQNVFFYPVNKGVTMFRQGAMTLPWAEGKHVPAAPTVTVSLSSL